MPSGHLVAYTAQIAPATQARAQVCMDKARTGQGSAGAGHAAGSGLIGDTRFTQENKK